MTEDTHRCAIPLDRAQLCSEGDCEHIWQLNGRSKCPSCGSDQSISLARILNRVEKWVDDEVEPAPI